MSLDAVGKWSFLIGLAVVIIAGLIPATYGFMTYIPLILFILGLAVGFLNITDKNTIKFLVSTIALLVAGVAGINVISIFGIVSDYVISIIGNFISFVGAAALVVSLKSIIETTKA